MRSAPRHPLCSTFAAAIALSSLLLSPAAHANLVVNGDFEAGATVLLPGGGGGVDSSGNVADLTVGNLSGWTLGPSTNSPNVVATNDQAYFALGTGGPQSGSLAAVFPNTPDFNGYMAQNVAGVVAGQTYQISFYLSNQKGDNALNYMSVNWGGTISSPGDPITGGTSLTGGSPSIPGAIPVPTAWTYYSFNEIATQNNELLSFIGGNTSAGNLIDDVSVVMVPEVSSFGIAMGIGLLAFGTVARIRRRAPLISPC
jgi:hypothetical protein